MLNEKHFYPTSEQKEVLSKTYQISFDDTFFGDTEERTDGTKGLVGNLNEWWGKICAEQNINPSDEKLKNVEYFLMELGKNALELRHNGIIKVIFEENRITVIVSNTGKGWTGNPNDDIIYGAPGHGLSQVKEFADEFFIETNQRKYTKVPNQTELNESDNPEYKEGSKITFIKNFE